MQKIGIFGGTFNPIHNGHLQLASAFMQALQLNKVIFVPTKSPVHKSVTDLASGEDRLAMCRLAVMGTPFEVSDIEINRESPSFTYLTLKHFSKEYKNSKLYFLVGEDMYLTIEAWEYPKKVYRLATICTASRSENGLVVLKKQAKHLLQYKAKTMVLDTPVVDISSTMVRNAIENGQDTLAFIPLLVAEYIANHLLYRREQVMPNQNYKELIRPFLSEKRYHHSICVAEECVRLAQKYGADEGKAELAGLLHDILKEQTPAEQLKMLGDSDIILTEVEESAQKLWHAKCGYLYLRDTLKITDEDILNAVYYHTTGRAEMSILEQILFVADFISIDREFEGVDEIRRAADDSLELAVFEGITFGIFDLVKGKKPIHPDSIAAYNWAVLHYKNI